jgi:hypothetical protein
MRAFIAILLTILCLPAAAEDAALTSASAVVAANRGGGKLLPARTAVMSASTDGSSASVTLTTQTIMQPWRTDTVEKLKSELGEALGTGGKPARVTVVSGGRALDDYVPPFLRTERKPRAGLAPRNGPPLVRRADPVTSAPTNGIAGRNIVVWPSHGVYFANKDTLRWEWQRPRMFTIVEDMLPMSFVNPYIIPMLENAGATVFSARERDFQVNEVVVDDGGANPAGSRFSITGRGFETTTTPGFRNGLAPFADGLNPHTSGTTHFAAAGPGLTPAMAQWIPAIPADGDYAVYVSYAASPLGAPDARYTVRHAGGETSFLVNQRAAGNTWVCLGTFHFRAGSDAARGSVELSNSSAERGVSVSADAVKFGGGMGDVLRRGTGSGYPRYAEGATTWLQYAGIDPDLVSPRGRLRGDEYTVDYTCRPEYANLLTGAPCGPNNDRSNPGMGVPVDISFAFHTDAGITTGTVGTLSIYTLRGQDDETTFPDGRDRMLNRDLADLVQASVVGDVRALFCSTWAQRDLADRSYAESRRPNMPSLLMELLSHQNYDDMKFALDPRFRFAVSRAIYKGMLRFLAQETGADPVVQPLPPELLEARSLGGGMVRVAWRSVDDPLEPTAKPDGFVVYRRAGDGGFDNGVFVGGGETTSVAMHVPESERDIQSFRVTAVNAGGESLPSGLLATRGTAKGAKRALVVDGFDRVAPPALVAGAREGADRSVDRGVGAGWTQGLTGDQFDFDRSHAWEGNDTPYTNDNPGHGASFGDLEALQELGNTRDNAMRHGEAFAAMGWGFDTVSARGLAADAAVQTSAAAALAPYAVVDWLLGEQRTTMPPPAHDETTGSADRMKPEFVAWPKEQQKIVAEYLAGGGRLLASGAYVATDLQDSPLATAADRAFLKDVLRTRWLGACGSRTNRVEPSATDGPFKGMAPLKISAGLGEGGAYGVESPGAIEGLPKSPPAVLRYSDGKAGAAVAAESGAGRVVVLAFPFECVVGADARVDVLRRAAGYLVAK